MPQVNPRVTLSLRQEHLRAACGLRQEERGLKPAPPKRFIAGLPTHFEAKVEGSATHQCLAQLPPGADLARASFYVGDACDVLATPSLDTSLSEQEARPSP